MKTLKNRVQLIGRLGKNPEIRELKNGQHVARFSLATTETFRNADGEKKQDVQWHNVVAWNKLAEIAANYLAKGAEVAVDGQIKYKVFDDNDGNTRYYTEIVVNELLMMNKSQVENRKAA